MRGPLEKQQAPPSPSQPRLADHRSSLSCSPPEAGPKPRRTTAHHSAPCAILSPPPRPPPPRGCRASAWGGQTGNDWQETAPPLRGLRPAQAPKPRPPHRLPPPTGSIPFRFIDPLDTWLFLAAGRRRRVQADQAERRVELMQPNLDPRDSFRHAAAAAAATEKGAWVPG